MTSADNRLNADLKFWILGIFIAFAFAWVVGYCFVDHIMVYEWNPVLSIWTFKPGLTYRHRSEGWATAHIGKYGVIGIPDISAIRKPKVVIWGDSHVEGVQVDDLERMPQVLTRLLTAEGLDMMAFGVGRSGESVADYYFKIPKYEKLCPPIMAHFIILCDLADVLPDQLNAEHARFVSQPTFRLVEGTSEGKYQRTRAFLAASGPRFCLAGRQVSAGDETSTVWTRPRQKPKES